MKELFYSLFAVFFRFWRIFPVKKNSVCFISMHNEGFHDSLGAVKDELERNGEYNISFVDKNDLSMKNPIRAARFFLLCSKSLAQAKYVFLNDNFLPMCKLNFSEKTTVVQLWHAEGVFKKFGLHIEQPDTIRNAEKAANSRIDYVVCSSKAVAPIYAEAFGVKKEQVLALGSARTDYLYHFDAISQLRTEFEKEHPECRGKKIVLYAPTFRDDAEYDGKITEIFDIERLEKELSDEYAFYIRLHPQIHSCTVDKKHDLTAYPDVTRLILLSDVLITDYSSVCMDFALLGKPCIFFAFDLEYYNGARSFYFDYESYVPGEVVKDIDALASCLKRETDTSKTESFVNFNFDGFDGKAAQRIVREIMNKGEQLLRE